MGILLRLINNLKRKSCVYSCVVDDHPKYYLQGYYFVISLIEVARVDPGRIFIHVTGGNKYFEHLMTNFGVNVITINKWGDNKYCNKLAQLDSPALKKAKYVFLCDADVCILEDIFNRVPSDVVSGKIVDFDNPELQQLECLYEHFNLESPTLSYDTLDGKPTFIGNFNGGIYGIPKKHFNNLGSRWKYFADKLLKTEKVKEILNEKYIHIDQIAFCMAINSLKLGANCLSYELNCPTHIKNEELLKRKIKNKPVVLHYHSKLTTTGMLDDINVPEVSLAIKEINKVISQKFNNSLFWDYRYKENTKLGSGIGS
jgi:hypothetical protein